MSADYTPEQISLIREAIAEARAALGAAGRFNALIFAQAFCAHGGVQIPGRPGDPAANELGAALLRVLAGEQAEGLDADLEREIERARRETSWAEDAERDDVIGFRLDLPPRALLYPACRELLKADRGLGSAVFRKAEIVVLPPRCDGARFVPVHDYEIEE